MNATYQSKKQKIADERCCYSKEWIEAKVKVLEEELRFAGESRRPELEEQLAYYQNKSDNFSEDAFRKFPGNLLHLKNLFIRNILRNMSERKTVSAGKRNVMIS